MKVKPLSVQEVDMVRGVLGLVNCMVLGLSRIDVAFGQARLGPSEKCVWLDDARRVTISTVEGGGYVATVGDAPDPEAVKL